MTKQLKFLKIFLSISVILLAATGCGKAENKSQEKETSEVVINKNCIDDIISRGKLVVGCKTDVPNLSLYDEETGEWSGMEVELAYETAAEIFGVSSEKGKDYVELVGVTFADREEKLESGEIDLMLATYTKTDEREKRFALSDSYYTDYIGLMVRSSGSDANSLGSGDITTISDLDGKYIGIPGGATTRDAFLNVISVSPIFCEFDSYDSIFKALKSGNIDVMAVDISILNGYVDNSTKILGVKFGRQDYAAAASKENSPLIEVVNNVIANRISKDE